jgi:HlyD family secretion protein
VQAQLGEFTERKVAAEDQLKRIDMLAPQGGIVHQLDVHTVGGVISPADVVMSIVPDSGRLAIEARIRPQDIDQIQLGQAVVLRLSAFNQRTTPELGGSVSRIAADLTEDPRSGLSYYVVRVALPAAELARLGPLRLSRACRPKLHTDRPKNGAFLSDQAPVGPDQPRISRGIGRDCFYG